MLVSFVCRKYLNAQMFVDVSRGNMVGAPVNLALISSYKTLGIVAQWAGCAIVLACCCCLRAGFLQLCSKLLSNCCKLVTTVEQLLQWYVIVNVVTKYGAMVWPWCSIRTGYEP